MGDGETKRNKEYPPEVLQAAYIKKMGEKMDELEKNMSKLTEVTKTTIPEGEKGDIKISVEDKWKKVFITDLPYPWVGFDLFNDGPSPVYFDINDHGPLDEEDSSVKPDESVEIDMRASVIDAVFLVCEEGKNTTVRIHAVK